MDDEYERRAKVKTESPAKQGASDGKKWTEVHAPKTYRSVLEKALNLAPGLFPDDSQMQHEYTKAFLTAGSEFLEKNRGKVPK